MASSLASENILMEWDKEGERLLESGVSHVALFVMNSNGNGYENGVAWSGITAISENPSGADVTDLYADNIKYASLRAAENYGFTIEAYTYPDEWAECDGSASPQAGVLLGQQTRRAFALAYTTQVGSDTAPGMDAGHKLHIVYNSTVSPSNRQYSTINNSPDAISFSWEATSTPVNVNSSYKPVSLITIDSTKLDSAKAANLATLEETIFGKKGVGNAAGTPGEMPTPQQVLNLLDHGTKADQA